MAHKIGGKRKQTDGGSTGGGSTAVAEQKTEVVDGREMGSAVSDSDLQTVKGYDPAALTTARQANDIVAFWSRVKSAGKGKIKTAKAAYIRLEAKTAKGMSILCRGVLLPQEKTEANPKPQTSVVDCFNYGFDLDRKAPYRIALAATLEGPDKAVKKMVQGLIAAEMTPDQIRALVHKTPKFAGVEGIDKLIDLALAK